MSNLFITLNRGEKKNEFQIFTYIHNFLKLIKINNKINKNEEEEEEKRSSSLSQ